jgi:membrane protein involved in colicin uptake
VLGNLPNSRPGRRSAKRDRPARTAAKAATKAEAGGKAAADPPRTAKAARTSAKPGAKAAGKASPKRTAAVKGARSGDAVAVNRPIDGQRQHDPPSDPVGAVLRGAAGVAITGARVAGAVTQELLRRLPRP